jgi:hypothetical protein
MRTGSRRAPIRVVESGIDSVGVPEITTSAGQSATVRDRTPIVSTFSSKGGRDLARGVAHCRVSMTARGITAWATPCQDHVVAATMSVRARTGPMLLADAQKHASTCSSVAPPTYHASTYDMPRRAHPGSTLSIRTTAYPAQCAACATAEPISSQPKTMTTGRPCSYLASLLSGRSMPDAR